MKNIFKFLSFENFKTTILNIISRFPITIIVITTTCVLFFITVHGSFTTNIENNIFRAIFSLIITYFFSVGVYLTSEKLEFLNNKKYLFQLIPILFGISFYIGFDKDLGNFNNVVFFILSLTGIISYIFIAPYTKELLLELKQGVYYSYFFKISVVFLISAIFGGVLFLLGYIGIMSVIQLFDLKDVNTEKMISDWAIIALSFATPIFALTQVPEKINFSKDTFTENSFFSFLVKYVGVPFIHIYFLILYAYSVKVLLNFSDWPKGEVSWLTIGFSTFGYIAYIFSYTFEDKNKFIKNFRRFLPYAVIPQLFMLFYAIGLRINQYDVTTNRYFVVIFGLWLLCLSLYFIISRKKSLSFIPALLTLFIIIISVGPWSVYTFPKERQYNRLLTNLEKAHIYYYQTGINIVIPDGYIVTPLKNYEDITPELSKELYSGIEYICDYDNCKSIKELFNAEYTRFAEKHKADFEKNKQDDLIKYANNPEIIKETQDRIYSEPSKWEIVAAITDYIKVKSYFDITAEDKIEYLNFHIDYKNNTVFPIDTTGYKKIYVLSSNDEQNSKYGKIDTDKQSIELRENGTMLEQIDIKKIAETLYNEYKLNKKLDLKSENMTFEVTGKNGIYKVILESFDIKNPLYKGATNRNYNYSNGYILVK